MSEEMKERLNIAYEFMDLALAELTCENTDINTVRERLTDAIVMLDKDFKELGVI